jgi:hypothetical protein
MQEYIRLRNEWERGPIAMFVVGKIVHPLWEFQGEWVVTKRSEGLMVGMQSGLDPQAAIDLFIYIVGSPEKDLQVVVRNKH